MYDTVTKIDASRTTAMIMFDGIEYVMRPLRFNTTFEMFIFSTFENGSGIFALSPLLQKRPKNKKLAEYCIKTNEGYKAIYTTITNHALEFERELIELYEEFDHDWERVFECVMV